MRASYSVCILPVILQLVSSHGGAETESKLLIVSLAGFRWDYLSGRAKTPNFDKIKENGVVARRGMKSAYITETLPNHFTLVTGLWVESHGMIGDTMWDPRLNETFEGRMGQNQDPRWWDVGAEPIWITNQLQKKHGRSGCMMWAGCEAPIMGMTPTRHQSLDGEVDFKTRVDILVKWFLDEYPINLGLLYFEKLEECGHKYGPDSKEVTAMIETVDRHVGYLLDQLEKSDLLKSMNLIITSNHGIIATPTNFLVNLDDAITPDSYRIFISSAVAGILPNEGTKHVLLFYIPSPLNPWEFHRYS